MNLPLELETAADSRSLVRRMLTPPEVRVKRPVPCSIVGEGRMRPPSFGDFAYSRGMWSLRSPSDSWGKCAPCAQRGSRPVPGGSGALSPAASLGEMFDPGTHDCRPTYLRRSDGPLL